MTQQNHEPAKKQPSNAGIVGGIALMVLAPVIGVITIVGTSVSSVGDIVASPTYMTDGSVYLVVAEQDTEMGIWLDDADSVSCSIIDPSGVAVNPEYSFLDSTVNDYELYQTFTPSRSGQYSVACNGNADGFKVAPVLNAAGLATGIIAGVLMIIVGILGGLALLIATVVRKLSWNRRYGPGAAPQYPTGQPYPQYGISQTPQYGSGPAQPYGAPPAQPYGAPPAQPYGAPPAQPYGVPPAQPYAGQPAPAQPPSPAQPPQNWPLQN